MAGTIAFLIALSLVVPFCFATPRSLRWSTRTYGPDGPWQAIMTQIGTPPQPIDLLPGGTWASNILTPTICQNATLSLVCYAETAGLYNSSASSTYNYTVHTGHIDNNYFNLPGALPGLFGSLDFGFDTIVAVSTDFDRQLATKALSFDMLLISSAFESLPDGTPYPLTIGKLSLGAGDWNQTWADPDGGPNYNGTFLPSAVYDSGQVESNSYGLHIGSASLGMPGSLFLGGYDQSRIVGPITTQKFQEEYLPIDLFDIGFGVADGRSPLNYSSKTGLLAHGNSSLGASVEVQIDASVPYMYLPKSTCDAMTQDLPVVYQPKYGLYFWNTSDPRYEMVSSPSFFSFTFRLDGGNTGNITINVPFPLLNLTLVAPLTTYPTQYFPCRPSPGPYILGRAFLQAAYVSVNWQDNLKGVWFLAQAPGPNTLGSPIPQDIRYNDTQIFGSNNDWKDSWTGFWTPITDATGTTSTPASSSSSSTGLSKGAIAGIATGATVAGLLILFLVVSFWRRHLRESTTTSTAGEHSTAFSNLNQFGEKHSPSQKYPNSGWGPREMNTDREPVELISERRPVELG